MRKLIKFILLLILLLVLAAIGLMIAGGVYLTSTGVSLPQVFSLIGGSGFVQFDTPRVREELFAGIDELCIDFVQENVTLRRGGDAVSVRVTEGYQDEYELVARDGRLTIRRIPFRPDGVRFGWQGLASFWHKGAGGPIEVTIPDSLDFVQLNGISGRIHAQDIQSDSWVLKTVSGQITLSGCTAGTLEIGAVSGQLKLSATAFERAYLQTVSGDIRLGGLADEQDYYVTLSTLSGRIRSGSKAYRGEYGHAGAAIRLEAETVSGDVYLEE